MLLQHHHNEHEDLTDKVIAEKLYSAENYSASVRLIIVLINAVAYLLLMDKSNTIAPLAYSLIALSLIYSVWILVYRPFDKLSLLTTSYATFVSDVVFVILWIIATGMAASPFYLLWYVSIIAAGQRFSFRSTLLISAVYALIYVVILRIDIGPIASAEMFLRVLYIPIIGVLAAYFSNEFEAQVEDKLKARLSEMSAVEAHKKQQELLSELRTIQKELETRVKQRTAELVTLNKSLKQQVLETTRAQEAQRSTLQKLAQTNTELENFAHITSHDLKAPLRGISTIADWLQEDYADKLDEPGQKSLEQLKLRAKKMNDLINGILKYSKAGVKENAFEEIDIEKVIKTSLNELLDRNGLEKLVAGSFPIMHYNRILVEQVIQNLLSNAYKYTQEYKGKITVSGHKHETEWHISIADNGKGIPQQYQKKVFEMFQTLETDTTNENTGVGLAIVKKIVTQWGGSVWVEQQSQSPGAVFTFTIPFKRLKLKKDED